MDENYNSLRSLLERIQNMGFWSRLFSWKRIQGLLVQANGDFQKLLTKNSSLVQSVNELKNASGNLQKDLDTINAALVRSELKVDALEKTKSESTAKITDLSKDLAAAESTVQSQNNQISDLESDRKVANQKLEQLNAEVTKLSKTSAATNEALENESKRRIELETEERLNKQKLDQLTAEVTRLAESLAATSRSLEGESSRKAELEIEVAGKSAEVKELRERNGILESENAVFKSEDERRRKHHDEKTATLLSITERVTNEREAEKEIAHDEEIKKLRNRKAVWSLHEETVSEKIKGICQKHAIEYLDKVPFKGNPDNTLKIAGEYIVFDAKSPASDNLSNFPHYLKEQAEKAKKYAKQENVKLEIYLVIPTNTLECVSTFVHRLGDYDVFIVSLDSLETTILSLKKIEVYEFAQSLSPDDRDGICRMLGKFMHLNKRRIQVDSFFIGQGIDLAFRSESDLPTEFFEKAIEFERSERLNPPTERRDKALSTNELEKQSIKIIGEAAARGVKIDQDKLLQGLNASQLYLPENDENSQINCNETIE